MQLRTKRVCAGISIIGVIAAIYILSNIDLVSKYRDCKANEVHTEELATVVNNTNGVVTYQLQDGKRCDVVIFGGSSLQPGSNAVVFRSSSGRCDTKAHDDTCDQGLVLFNILYTLFGVMMTVGCLQSIYSSLYNDPTWIEELLGRRVQPNEPVTLDESTTTISSP